MKEEWADIFKDLIDDFANEREQKARRDITASYIKSVMESLQVNSEKAMDVLKIPKNQQSTYAALVAQA